MKWPNKKTIVCIFAHPDDEAFGSGGTIAKLVKTNDVYLICATKGESGKERGKMGSKNLGKIREHELLASAKILGIKKVFSLGFKDGELCNNLYHSLAAKIEAILKKLRPEIIMTHEPRGGSGHIDHIVVSMVTSFVFERLPFIKTVLQHCLTEKRARKNKGYFIYVPYGYKDFEIDLKVDVRDTWDTKIRAITRHQSQIHDVKRILKRSRGFPKVENFLVRSKK